MNTYQKDLANQIQNPKEVEETNKNEKKRFRKIHVTHQNVTLEFLTLSVASVAK